MSCAPDIYDDAWYAVELAIEAFAVARHKATLAGGVICSPHRESAVALIEAHSALEQAIRDYAASREVAK